MKTNIGSGKLQKDKKNVMELILKIIESKLSPKRLEHVNNVVELGAKLSKLHAPELVNKVILTALLHDILKEESIEVMRSYCENKDFPEIKNNLDSGDILHGFAGSVFVEEDMGIMDKDIINAIRYHTIGRENMSTLEKIIYVADLTAADRTFPGVDIIRETALKDLEKGFLMAREQKEKYVKEKQQRMQ